MYLGIDLGTSAVKCCVLDDAGGVVATSSAPLRVQYPFEGASEQDCAAWWTATSAAIHALDPSIRTALRGIGLSGQMHGAVLLGDDGLPLRPVILWNDARAQKEAEDILAAAPEAGEISGALPMAGFTAPKLLWLARHEPEIHARIASVLLPKDYLGFRLHGQYVTDPSDAAGTSWFDESRRGWSERLCAASATKVDWLPEVRHGTEIAGHLDGHVAEELGLPSGIPVATGGGDAACGAVGIGAVIDGDGFISLGTSGQLFVATSEYRPNLESRIHAYAHTVPGMWFQMAAMLNGARPMAWLSDLLKRPIGDLLAEAETAPDGPLFLPYLTGERTPHGDTGIRAGFAMLGETTSQGGLMRSVIEAIAFTFADAIAALGKAGPTPASLLAIGGGTRADLLMQSIADVTGCAIGRSGGADVGPALGAARLGVVAAEGVCIDDVVTKPVVNHWFEPRAGAVERLRPRLEAYRALYPALNSVQSALTPHN